MRVLAWACLTVVGLVVALFGGALAFGTSPPPPELRTVSSPFKSVDFTTLPPLQSLSVRHGSPIAYRTYGPADARDVVLALHGSTGSSAALHPLALTLSAAAMRVYVPDIRGHGATGRRGDLDYLGQAEDDVAQLAEMVAAEHPNARRTLLGHSLGGGLALRMAARPEGDRFDRAVLLAPALGRQSPTQRSGSDDPWARPHIGRIMAVSLLGRVGIHVFDGLPVIDFAVPPGSEAVQTGRYSHRLLFSLIPSDHRTLLRDARIPLQVLIAENDEMFSRAAFEPAIHPFRPDAKIVVVEGVNHIGLTLDPRALVRLVQELR